jgi:hypothetical protein
MLPRTMMLLGCALILFVDVGCLPSWDDPDGDGFPETPLLTKLPNREYARSSDFTQVNRLPYDTTVTPGAKINVWVSSEHFAQYSKITPNASDSGVHLPTGAIIIREVLDQSGNLTKLTLMSKGSAGWNPDLGDYWFGVTSPDGTPVEQNGKAMIARLSQCYSCHLGRVNDDYLFGVGLTVRDYGALDHP